jgi:membrane-associated phospholipid phosphatase
VLLPGAARRVAALLVCCCAVLVAVGAIIAAGKSHGNALDQPVDSWIRGHIGTDRGTLQHISDAGVYGADLVAVVLVVIALVTRRWAVAAMTLISVPVAFVLTEYIIKPLVRERIDNFFTYPSGHTEAVFCVAAIIAVALVSPPGGRPARWLRVLIVGLTVAAGIAVAVSMIGLDYHYFTDTVAGAAIGIAVVLSTALSLDAMTARRRLRRQHAPGGMAGTSKPDAAAGLTAEKPPREQAERHPA